MVKYNYKNLANESNFSSQVHRAGIFDKILGISKAAEEAANQVITEMGDDLKAEARKAAKAEVNEKAQEIEKNILKSVNENATNPSYGLENR